MMGTSGIRRWGMSLTWDWMWNHEGWTGESGADSQFSELLLHDEVKET